MGRRKQTAPRSLRLPDTSSTPNDKNVNAETNKNDGSSTDKSHRIISIIRSENDCFNCDSTIRKSSPNSDLRPKKNADSTSSKTDCTSISHKKISGLRNSKSHRKLFEGKNHFLVCQSCYKTFKHKKSLQRHMKLHSGIRKHKCALCAAAFIRSDHLRSHIKTHFARSKRLRLKKKLFTANKKYQDESNVELDNCDTTSCPPISDDMPPATHETVPPDECVSEPVMMKQECSPSPPPLPNDDDPSNYHTGETGAAGNNLPKQEEEDETANNGVDHTSAEEAVITDSIKPEDREEEATPENVIICPTCGQQLPDVASFVWHMSFSHQQQPPQLHEESPLSLQFPAAEQQQMLLSSPPGLSPAATAAAELLAPTICVFCGALVPGPQVAVFHLVAHFMQARKGQSCQKCPVQSVSSGHLQSHGREKHRTLVYQCDLCDCLFPNEASFDQHYSSQHVQDTDWVTCLLCPESTFTEQATIHQHMLARHMKYYPSYAQLTPPPMLTHSPPVLSAPSSSLATRATDAVAIVRKLAAMSAPSSGKRQTASPGGGENGRPRLSHPPPPPPPFPHDSSDPSLDHAGSRTSSGSGSEVVSSLISRMCHTCHRLFADEMEVLKHQVQAHRICDEGGDEGQQQKTQGEQGGGAGEGGKRERPHWGDRAVSRDSEHPKRPDSPQHHHNPTSSPPRPNGGLPPIVCSYCGLSHRNQTDLERHIASSHFTTPHSLKCNICDQLFPNQSALHDHKESHKRAPTPDTDSESHHPRRRRRESASEPPAVLEQQSGGHCRLCGKLASEGQLCSMCLLTLSYLKQRLQPAAAPTYVCDQCGKVFESTFQLEMHTITHEVSVEKYNSSSSPRPLDLDTKSAGLVLRPFKKPLDKPPVAVRQATTTTTAEKRSLAESVSSLRYGGHSGEGGLPGKFTCLVCDQWYTSEEDLLAHKQEHLKALRIDAYHFGPDCDTVVAQPTTKLAKSSQQSNVSTRFKCRQCSQQFKSWENYRLHKILRHSRQKPNNTYGPESNLTVV